VLVLVSCNRDGLVSNCKYQLLDKVISVSDGPCRDLKTLFPILVSSLQSVTIQVDGRLIVNNNITAPEWTRGGVDYGVMELHDSANIEITGVGVYDGDGYNWWWSVFLTGQDYRPHLTWTSTLT
jgi:hypothetical protein